VHARLEIDLIGGVLEQLAARIVGDRHEVDHMVDAVEMGRLEPAAVGPDLLEMLMLGQELASEEEAVESPDLVARGQQHGDEGGADVASGARDENALHEWIRS
jgi:hypothetical protein